MIPGSYSSRFKAVEKQHLDQLKEQYAEERTEILQRSRKLSAETSRRRKALAIKRRTDAHREEKRRQEILHRRREQIRAATEKYQRGNSHYSPKNYEDDPAAGYGTPSLEEALAAVRGGSAAPRVRGHVQYTTASPGSYVSPHTGHAQGRITSASSVRSVSSNHGDNSLNGALHHYNYTTPGSAQPRRTTTQAKRVQLQNNSLRNLNSSRSLFEQQLEQHQQLLVEEQQQSLHHFNEAIRNEIDQDPKLQGVEEVETPGEEVRCESSVSADSLEEPAEARQSQVVTRAMLDTIRAESKYKEQRLTNQPAVESNHTAAITRGYPVTNQNGYPVTNQNGYHQSRLGSAGTTGRSSFILQNNRSSQSPVAVVQPQVHQPPNSPEPAPEKDTTNRKTGQANPTQESSAFNMIATKSNGRYNGQYYQDSVVGFVNGLEPANNVNLHEDMPHQDPKGTVVAGPDPTNKVWATPASAPAKQQSLSSTPYNKVAPSVPVATDAQSGAPVPTVTCQTAAPKTDATPGKTTGQTTGQTHGTFTVVHSAAPAPKAHYGPRPVTVQASSHVQNPDRTKQPSTAATNAAMEALKQYTQYPVFKVVGRRDSEDKLSVQSETSTLVSGSDVAEESQPEPSKEVKSILKKFSSYGGPIPGTRSASNLTIGGKRTVTRSKSANPMLRDSLEVTKHRRDDQPQKHKKNVRFADLTYSDDSDGEDTTNVAVQPSVTMATVETDVSSGLRPPRPVSARPTMRGSSTSPSKIPRVASAGTARRGPFLRPHPPTHPPTGRATRNHQRPEGHTRPTETTHNSDVHHQGSRPFSGQAKPEGQGQEEHKGEEHKKYAVYDANGIRLDRTPTDDEINFLWDKVRTCLSRQSMSSTTSSVQPPDPAGSASRKSQSMSQKYIDGNTLAPQHRVTTRLNNTYTNNYMGTQTIVNNNSQKKKVSMDTLNNYTKKASLLNQRTKQTPASTGATTAPYQTVTTTTQALHEAPFQQAPVNSMAEPTRGAIYMENGQNNVSESMAAFLTAEQMAAQSVSESEIEAAMENARVQHQATNGTTAQPEKVPTALSIEEQRLVQSLERLNERLKLNETNMYPTTSHVPNPPPHKPPPPSRENKLPQYGGFKGRQPITTSVRRHVTSNGTVPRHQYGGGSATLATPSSGSYTASYRYR